MMSFGTIFLGVWQICRLRFQLKHAPASLGYEMRREDGGKGGGGMDVPNSVGRLA